MGTIMDCFLVAFIFLFWAAISILLLLQPLPSASINFMASLAHQTIWWQHFMVYLFLTTKFGQGIWFIILAVLCIVCIVPIVFYSFYNSVYNFDPKHCKQSLMDILLNPVPGIEFEG